MGKVDALEEKLGAATGILKDLAKATGVELLDKMEVFHRRAKEYFDRWGGISEVKKEVPK